LPLSITSSASGHDRALDAAAGYAAEEIALVVDHEIRADRPRRRAPGLDNGGERNAAPRPPSQSSAAFRMSFIACE
jgi:hypothetical protein